MADAGSPDADGDRSEAPERAWLEAELSAVVRDRRRLENALDRTGEELAVARRELAGLRVRRSVRAALAISDVARRVGSKRETRSAVPTERPGGQAPSDDDTPRHPTPAEFRSRLGERLSRENEPTVVHVERVDRAMRDDDAPNLGRADILTVSSTDFDVRRVRGQAVTVAFVGPDARPWLDLPWLDDFDIIATPSPASIDAIRAARSKVPVLVTDPNADIRGTVSDWLATTRIGIAVGIPDWKEAPAWGDLHFARALQRQFERSGHPTRIHLRPDWTDAVSARDDVSVHLFGLSGRQRLAGQLTLLWVISHPERVSDPILASADRVYAASRSFADELALRSRVPVRALTQATDAERFHPDPSGLHHDVLFVGNSRGVRRDIVADLVPTTLDLAVYGRWSSDRLGPPYLRGELIPNEELHRFYSSAGVVLNDHWPDMRAAGLLSNRIYDALASGACVVSDHVDGIEDEFDGGVATYVEPGELRLLLRDLLADPGRRQAMADRGRAAVLERHTFVHRAAVILGDIADAATGSRSGT